MHIRNARICDVGERLGSRKFGASFEERSVDPSFRAILGEDLEALPIRVGRDGVEFSGTWRAAIHDEHREHERSLHN